MVKMLLNLLKVLNSEAEPGQLSLALSLSMFAGFLPFFSLYMLALLLLILLLRVNLSAFLLGMAFFSGVAYLIDPLFNAIGVALLTAASLEGLWTAMYNTTIWRIAKFNNSVIMGSIVFSVLLFVPLYLISNLAIRRYREHVLAWVLKTRLMKLLTASKFYQLYQTLS